LSFVLFGSTLDRTSIQHSATLSTISLPLEVAATTLMTQVPCELSEREIVCMETCVMDLHFLSMDLCYGLMYADSCCYGLVEMLFVMHLLRCYVYVMDLLRCYVYVV